MKKLFTLLLFFHFAFILCQKVELKSITDSSQVFKGEIAGMPITMQLYYAGIADCSLFQYFVDGWYYYDKYQKKIPLVGIYDYGKLYLYNFGNKQKQNSKIFKDNTNSPQSIEKVDEIAKKLIPKESIHLIKENENSKIISGHFYLDHKTQSAKLFTSNNMIYRYNNYLTLPNNKKINTFDFINHHGGNHLVSYVSGEKGNRVLLYFEHSSNFNACGRCGASEGEKGYRVLYFTKDWNYKNYEEFITESCIEGIYDSSLIKNKDSDILKFNVKKTSSSPAYTLTVDLKNASVIKSK